jgi:hypothetical protein
MIANDYTTPKQILFNVEHQVSIGVIVADTGVVADGDGNKIIPAGTPVGGATSLLTNRSTPAVVTNVLADGANAQGVLLHDVDVTAGNANGTMLIWGFVNLDRLDVTPVAEAVTALANKVTFINGL